MITLAKSIATSKFHTAREIAKLTVIALVAALLALIPLNSSSAALVSQFQAQSLVSVYIPANQPVPAQGSTVSLSFDRADFTGANAARDYQSALSTGATATVRYVVADLGYRTYPNVNTIANSGDLGYLVILDFGSGRDFGYAHVGYLSFTAAATAIDATGTAGLFHFQSGGADYLWAPASLDVSNVTGVVDSWGFTTLTAITATASHTLNCAEVVPSYAQTTCNSLGNKVGSSLRLATGPTADVTPDRFYGLAGLQSVIVGGLVQTSLVSLPTQQVTTQQSQTAAYKGPEIHNFSPNGSVFAGREVIASGRKLETVTAATIDGKVAKHSYDAANGLTIETPADLKPGTYDLVLQSPYGKLTHINAIKITAPVELISMSLRGSGSKIDGGLATDLSNLSLMFGSDFKKVTCVVNASDAAVAEALAAHVCKYVKSGDLRSAAVSSKAKSTFKGEGFWVRVYLAG